MKVTLQIAPNVRDQLRQSLVPEQDLLNILSKQQRHPVPDEPNSFRYSCPIPLPRPMDPETAEMRVLDVFLRPQSEGVWEIYRVEGLPEETAD